MECAVWLMNATVDRIATIPSTSATRIETLGTTASPPLSTGPRTARSTTRQ